MAETVKQLRARALEAEIPGASKMNKAQLLEALGGDAGASDPEDKAARKTARFQLPPGSTSVGVGANSYKADDDGVVTVTKEDAIQLRYGGYHELQPGE